MSVDVKALRALRSLNGRTWPPVTMDELIEGWNALPALLDLADAVRELAPLLRSVTAVRTLNTRGSTYTISDEQEDAARRVLAILESK